MKPMAPDPRGQMRRLWVQRRTATPLPRERADFLSPFLKAWIAAGAFLVAAAVVIVSG